MSVYVVVTIVETVDQRGTSLAEGKGELRGDKLFTRLPAW